MCIFWMLKMQSPLQATHSHLPSVRLSVTSTSSLSFEARERRLLINMDEHAKDGQTLREGNSSHMIACPKQNFKNPLSNFFGINLQSLCTKLQLSSFKTEEWVWGDWHPDRRMTCCYPIHALSCKCGDNIA